MTQAYHHWQDSMMKSLLGTEYHWELRSIFKPNTTRSVRLSKMEPQTLVGVFMGYASAPGMKWSGEYVVMSLDDFVGRSLASTSEDFTGSEFTHPFRVKALKVVGRLKVLPWKWGLLP